MRRVNHRPGETRDLHGRDEARNARPCCPHPRPPTEDTMNTTELNTATATQVPETRANDMKLEVVILPVSDAERTQAVLRVAGLARGCGLRLHRGLPGPAVHAARLRDVAHLRHRRHDRRPRVGRQPAAGRRGHRGGARRADRARRRRVRGLPRRGVQRGPRASRARPGPRAQVLQLVRDVQRSRRERVPAAGGHLPSARPGGRDARRHARASSCSRRPCTTTASRRPRRPTTGGTGTRRT